MILIVGCGYLGSYLLKHIRTHSNEHVIATVRNTENTLQLNGVEYVKCDISNESDLALLCEKCKGEPLTVFYFAACHNVDYVYEHPEIARKINLDALKQFLSVVPNIKKLFFASTDCVYGEGRSINGKFHEQSSTIPVNEYGRQKLEAESLVISNGFTVLRLPFMLGPSLFKKRHFYDNICSSLRNGEKIKMIDGMKRSLISYAQAAEFIYSLSLCENDIAQIINVCADNELSKADIGFILADKIGASKELIECISEDEAVLFFTDKRASVTSMDNSLLKNILGIEKIQWEEEI